MKKIDKNKVYAFIGKAVVWTSIHILLGLVMFDVAINCMTVYRQEESMEILKNIQTILVLLLEHSIIIVAVIVGILALIGIIFTNKIKNDNKISQINKETNKKP